MEVLTAKFKVGLTVAVFTAIVAAFMSAYQIDGWQKMSLFVLSAAALGGWLGTKMCD